MKTPRTDEATKLYGGLQRVSADFARILEIENAQLRAEVERLKKQVTFGEKKLAKARKSLVAIRKVDPSGGRFILLRVIEIAEKTLAAIDAKDTPECCCITTRNNSCPVHGQAKESEAGK